MTEKPNSVCKHKTREEAMLCPNYRRLVDVPDLAAEYFHGSEHFEPAEPSASPRGITDTYEEGDENPNNIRFAYPKVSAEPTADYHCPNCNAPDYKGTCKSCKYSAHHEHLPAAPQPVAGEGPPKFFDGELMPIHWCPGLKKFVRYPSLFCLKHNRGSGEVDYVPVTSEGTPKLEEIAAKYIDDPAWREKFLMHDAKAALVEFANAILRPFITPACSPPNGKMEISAQEYGNLLAIWQTAVMLFSGLPNELPDVEAMRQRMHKLATPASTGEANGLEMEFRRYMWLNHGHEALYGDDGEMQCKQCPLDFKRALMRKIHSTLADLEMRKFAAPTSVPQAEPRLPWTDEQLGEHIWTQIDEQGANGNICKPLGICDERFDRVFAEVVKARAAQAEPKGEK